MYFYMCLCGALLIVSAQSGTLNLPEISHTSKKSSSDSATTDLFNKTNLTLVSEGGALLPDTPDLSLPKQKLNSLIALDEELTKTKEKAVVARKGVDIETDEKNSSQPELIGNLKPKEALKNTVKSPTAVINESTDIHVKSVLSNLTPDVTKLNKTEVPKKPTILSYEALANTEKQIQKDQSKIPVAPSTITMASSQIPSPNQDSIKKVYPSKANNSHPGMIMPIVITILVVPMFAIVGYFALKRGQEAWKNRHYKRMDFLLDGMYND